MGFRADHHPDITLKCVFPFYMTVLGKKQEFNDCTDKGNPGRILGAFTDSALWCSADEDFDENKRFVPCADSSFYQGCGMLDKEEGTWTTHYGDKASLRPENEDEAMGCYSSEYYVCEMMKEGIDRPSPTRPPILGDDCLGQGWEGYTDNMKLPSTHCYKVFSWHNEPTGDETKNNTIGVDFSEAVAFCRAQGADLVSLHSADQEKNVFDIIKKYEDRTAQYRDWYWLGVNDRGHRGYQWTDGTGLDYLNWAAGEPAEGDKASLEECAIIINNDEPNPMAMGWYSQYCNIQAGVVCGIQRGAQPNDTITPPNQPIPDDECNQADYSGSGITWYSFDHKIEDDFTSKKCFGLVNDRSNNYYDADKFCKGVAESGNLISIHHNDDMYKILQVLRADRDSEYYIGYNFIGTTMDYEWTDGSPLDYDNFAPGYPGDEWYYHDATYIQSTLGTWVTTDALESRYFICQFWPQGQPEIPAEETHTGGCLEGWYPFGNKCFQFVGFDDDEQRKNQSDANAVCQTMDPSATLASLYDEYYDAFVYAHMVNLNQDIYFGLFATDPGREWTYVDGSKVYYTPWANGEPNNANGNEYCAVVSRQHGQWNDINCGDTYPFVCSMWKNETNNAPEPNPNNCPTGYKPFETGCFKIVNTGAANFDAAQAACEADRTGIFTSAGLASIWDVHENYMLKALMHDAGITSANNFAGWIGLYFDRSIDVSDDPESVKFRWTDKHPVTYTHWAGNEPQTPPSTQKGCATIDAKGGWKIENCAESKPYICKLESSYNPDEQDDPGRDKCGSEWIGFSGWCYQHTPTSYNFNGAVDACSQMEGAKLASVHSDAERRFLSSIDKGDKWIGMARNEQGGFEWIDGSGVDYEAWQKGEPNNGSWDGENCVIQNGQGFWNDVSCDGTWADAICRKPSLHEWCEVAGPDRTDCGYPGIDATTCINFGCCYDPLDGHNWCFHPKQTAACESAGGAGWDSKCVDYG